jgi:ribonucleotide reductase alpha subunit
MRMGIGITGYLQATEEQKSWLSDTYNHLRKYDKMYSELKGWPVSIKLTTIKPSGTLSLLPGVTPGIHPAYARHMIRRIRIASNSSLIEVCRKHGYKVEPQRKFDGSEDLSTMVVEFPFSYPKEAVLASEMSAVDQLEVVRRLQQDWSDNAVSCTVYYKKEELPAIKEYLLANYNDNFKSLSFLLHNEHGFDQAPLEEISASRYKEIVENTTLITSIESDEELVFEAGDECATGACPIK